jgi:3-keto-5-aminohexanoate cleavage enzyme
VLLGLHVRVGMEDTLWPYPHRDDIIKRNVDHFLQMKAIAELLGRELMTAAEYREAIGLPPKVAPAKEKARV